MAYGARTCPRCGLVLEGPLAAELFTTLSAADDLLARMRTAQDVPRTAPQSAVAAPSMAGATSSPAAAGEAAAGSVTTVPRPHGSAVRRDGGGGLPPAPGPVPHGGLSGTSVPKILLGLGALCLLVAALVFLAVTWSAMGVAGRTATLVGFTALAGAMTTWAARRDLRAAAESLGVVTLGLLAFDLVGARDAGWLGADVDTPTFLVVLGATLVVVGSAAARAVRRTPITVLVSAEVVATLGLVAVTTGLVSGERLAWSAAATLAVVVAAAVAGLAHLGGLRVLAPGAGLVTLAAWVVLALSSLDRAVAHPSFAELWAGLEVWALLVTAALVGVLGVVRRLPDAVRLVAVGTAVVLLAAAVLAPAADETTTVSVAAAAAALAALAVLSWVLPRAWRRSLAGAGALGLLWMAGALVQLTGIAFERIVVAGSALWSGAAGDAFTARSVAPYEAAPWLLPVVVVVVSVALVAAARSFPWADRTVAPLADVDVALATVGLTTVFTLASYPVPLWLVLGVLLAAGAGFSARAGTQHAGPALAFAAGFSALALQLSLHAPWLTLATLLVLLGSAAWVHLRSRDLDVSVVAGALVAGTVAGLVWTGGELLGSAAPWVSVVALVLLAGLVLGMPYVDERLRVSGPATYARLGLELGALLAAAVVSLAGVADAGVDAAASWAAAYLTLMGATASALALLRPDRRAAGWLGGLLLAAASWVRLADLGVDTPEAYTLPSALALLVVGLVHLHRHPASGSMIALTPGLALALVPSLLWALADPIALRSLLLGAATLGLVVAGLRLRWSAPVVHGAAVGAVLVVRLATPLADAVPRWALIGAAGVALVAMGITWEQRVRDARRVAGYVRGLR